MVTGTGNEKVGDPGQGVQAFVRGARGDRGFQFVDQRSTILRVVLNCLVVLHRLVLAFAQKRQQFAGVLCLISEMLESILFRMLRV
jgi:hypothetical protein